MAQAPPIRDRIRSLRRVRAGDLLADPRNWRRHPPAQARAVRSMLEDVGLADAILVRETPEGLVIIDGHLRASLLPDDKVPVLVIDVDEEEAGKLLATLDPLAAMAETDREALDALLETVTIDDADLAAFLAPTASRQGLTDPDAIPEAPEAITKPGDLWVLGEHRLLCEDATDPAAQARILERADRLLVTDPPYGVDYTEVMAGRANQKAGGWRPIEGDNLRGADLQGLLQTAFVLSQAATAFVWFAHDQRHWVEGALRESGFTVKQEIIWVKSALVFSRADYHWRHEQAIYATRKGHQPPPSRDQTTVWELDKPRGGEHPTQKPVELYGRAIRNHTKPGDVVFDPFCGSGSLLIAAEMERRAARAVEIDPAYCDIAVRRWEDYTGEKAVRG